MNNNLFHTWLYIGINVIRLFSVRRVKNMRGQGFLGACARMSCLKKVE